MNRVARSNSSKLLFFTQSFLLLQLDNGEKDDSYNCPACFPNAIIIAVLLPVAVVRNKLILGATQRKTFQKTPFHWSGLVLADLCAVLIAQPFIAVTDFLYCTNLSNRPFTLITIDAIGDTSVTYFISITVFIITLMAVERRLHMTRRSLVTSTFCDS